MVRLIDFHIHIDYYENFRELYKYFEINEIYTLFVTNLPEIFEKCKREFPQSKYVKLGLGYNPQLAKDYQFNIELFDNMLPFTKYIGEVGLDYSKDFVNSKNEQQNAFEYICKRAREYNKILSIHSRMAEKDSLDILIENKVELAVFHWYSGSEEVLEEIIRNGYYLSVNYSMLTSKKGLNIIKAVPPNRMLIETDAPFGKVSLRGRPYNLPAIYEEFEKKLDMKNFSSLVSDNLKTLLLEQINKENNLI
jgi:TatD DNase family protein